MSMSEQCHSKRENLEVEFTKFQLDDYVYTVTGLE